MTPGFVYEDRGYATPCRVWTGATRGSGPYGVRSRAGRLVYVHRDEWERARGAIPAGLCVLHRCDVPLCAEVEHLFLGTQRANVRDALAKGRLLLPVAVGDMNGRARLSWAQVRRVRTSDAPHVALARELGVSEGTIRHIRSGRRWRDAA